MWFIGVEIEQETSAPPPKKNPGSPPVCGVTITGESGGDNWRMNTIIPDSTKQTKKSLRHVAMVAKFWMATNR